MTAFRISFNHSCMKPDFRGHSLKHASSPEEAAKFLGKYDKKAKTIVDKRFCTLSNVVIEEYDT